MNTPATSYKVNNYLSLSSASSVVRRDRLVVRTLRCGRSNPSSNPGPGIVSIPFCFNFKRRSWSQHYYVAADVFFFFSFQALF